MTVTTTAAALLAWVFAISLFLNWYYGRKLSDYRHAYELEKKINNSNSRHHAQIEATLVSGILERANVTNLPPLNSKKWHALTRVYDSPDMAGYNIAAQITTDHNDTPAVYWKVTNVNELDAYEIARLWLAGVL